MKVILIQDVASLGKVGDLVKVSDGYARNYLIPRGLGMEASSGNVKNLEIQKQTAAKKADKKKKTAQGLVEALEGVTCHFSRKVGQQDKLFGSVTSKDIAGALSEQGIEVDKKDIVVDEQIKSVGEFPVKIKVHSGMSATITIIVSGEE